MSSRDSKLSAFARLSLVALPLLVGGCQDYAARRDTIAFHAGEAAAYNKAIHTIDPWPAAAARTDLDFDGERAVRTIARYEAGGDPPPQPGGMATNLAMPVVATPR